WVGAAVIGTTAAQLATVGMTISAFGQVSPVGLPANVAIGPAVDVAFPFAALAALAAPISTTLSGAIELPAELAGAYVVWAVGLLADGIGPVNTRGTSTWATAGVVAVGIGGIVALSEDCRLALRRTRRAIAPGRGNRMRLAVPLAIGVAIGLMLAL